MAERIYMAKEATSQEILANTEKINDMLVEAAAEKPKRYGIRINNLDSNPKTRVEYILDAVGMKPAYMNFNTGGFDYGDWGDVWFVKNNRPVMLNNDGTVAYELDHNNHALKMDGTASDITKTAFAGNAMSEIPLVWVKRYTVENYDYIIFCETQYDETYKAYAHTDAAGNILPVTYFPMYEGAIISEKMRSLSGQTVTASTTDDQETIAAQQNGEQWDKLSYSEVNLMYEMCTMISKNTNAQEAFGSGNSSSDTFLTTGTMNGMGQFYGYNTTANGLKLFYCENFFGNYWKRIRGLLNISGKIHIKLTPPYDSTGAGYTDTGVTPDGTSGGYISRMVMTEGGRIPKTASGSETTFETDGLWFNNEDTRVAIFGGPRSNGSRCGLAAWSLNDLASAVSTYFGASLSCKPPVAA